MESWDQFRLKTILVDTNFLFDVYNAKEKYATVLTEIQQAQINLVSTDLVRIEFIRSRDKRAVEEKAIYFSEFIDTSLPMDPEVMKLIQPTIEEYGKDIDGVSPVDITLACCIKRYHGLYLLTRNHKDFPTKIFSRDYIFSVEHNRDVKTYALYYYMPKSTSITIAQYAK